MLKVITEDDIIVDISPSSKSIYIHEENDFTEIYFKPFKNIKEAVSKYESIKLIADEKIKTFLILIIIINWLFLLKMNTN